MQKGTSLLLISPQPQPKVCHSQQQGQVLHSLALHSPWQMPCLHAGAPNPIIIRLSPPVASEIFAM